MGKETVQLYIHDLFANTVRPIQPLIAIELAPDGVKAVIFMVSEPMLRFYDANCNFF